MDFDEIKYADQKYVANTYSRFDVNIINGNNATCFDCNGKKYIDFTSGIGVNSLGFCNPGWTDAVKKQLDSFAHISNLYYTKPCVELAKSLCDATGCCKVFFGNSGAEANEGAIKAARKYSADKYDSSRHEIVTLVNSFHGRTITTLCATGQEIFHEKFTPLTPGFSYANAGDMPDLEAKVTDKTCAIMLEMIQGEGGVIPLDANYVKSVELFCKSRDILLIVDEVQTGAGRTGKFLCCEHYNIRPDIVTLAKGLGGGLPIGAVLLFGETGKTLSYGDHGSTFGGNPVACAGANFVMKTLTPDFLKQVELKGDKIRERLSHIPQVTSVTGKGLMIGISISEKMPDSKKISAACAANGLLILTAKEKLRMLPPLTILNSEIEAGLNILENILKN